MTSFLPRMVAAACLLLGALLRTAHGEPPRILLISSSAALPGHQDSNHQLRNVVAALHASGSLYRITSLSPNDAVPNRPTAAILDEAARSDVVIATGLCGLHVLSHIPLRSASARVWLPYERGFGALFDTRDGAGTLWLPTGLTPPSLVVATAGELDGGRIDALTAQGITIFEAPSAENPLSAADARAAYEKIRFTVPGGAPHLLVLLDDDPDRHDAPANRGRGVTPWEAADLARRILAAPDFKRFTLLLTNQPRTGALSTVAKRGSARRRVSETPPTDQVTQAFLDVWRGSGRPYRFYPHAQDAWKGLVGAVAAGRDSVLLMPGGSMEAAAAALSVVPRQRIVIYESGAMDEKAHRAVTFFGRQGIALAPLRAPLALPIVASAHRLDDERTLPSVAQMTADAIESLLEKRRRSEFDASSRQPADNTNANS